MKKDRITIEKLGVMVQKGFEESGTKFNTLHTEVKDGFKNVSNRLDVLEHELLSIKKDLENVVYRHEFELIKERVKNLESRVTAALSKKK